MWSVLAGREAKSKTLGRHWDLYPRCPPPTSPKPSSSYLPAQTTLLPPHLPLEYTLLTFSRMEQVALHT